jgi:hypothetical protein
MANGADHRPRRGRIPFMGLRPRSKRSQPAVCSKTLRAARLLAVGRIGSVVTAHSGYAPPSPPCPHPKSLAAAPLAIFRQALLLYGRSPQGSHRSRNVPKSPRIVPAVVAYRRRIWTVLPNHEYAGHQVEVTAHGAMKTPLSVREFHGAESGGKSLWCGINSGHV